MKMLNNKFSIIFIVTSSLLLLSTVSAFGFHLFLPGFPINAGGSNMMVFSSDSPKLVTFKITVQNKDNNLSALESFSAPNTMTGDFVMISIPDGVKPGINHWFVAVDSTNDSNYATLGPLVIRKMFGSTNPTASINAGSSSNMPYQISGNNVAASSTGSLTYADPTSSSTTINRVSPKISHTSLDSEDDHTSPISVGTIIGIGAGGIAFLIIVSSILYVNHEFGYSNTVITLHTNSAIKKKCFCFKKTIKTIEALVNNLTISNDNKNKQPFSPVSQPSTAVNMPGIHKILVSPLVTSARPQKQAIIVMPNSQSTPSSPSIPAPNTTDFSFNFNNENTNNRPYSPTIHLQQIYPSCPYPYNYNRGFQTKKLILIAILLKRK